MDNLMHMAIPNKKDDHTKRYGRLFLSDILLSLFYLLR